MTTNVHFFGFERLREYSSRYLQIDGPEIDRISAGCRTCDCVLCASSKLSISPVVVEVDEVLK